MVSSPMLAPKLTPETTTSGVKSSSPVTAIWTQSVGVPLTKKKPFGALRTERGRSSVSELEAPGRSRSGATTVTSPSWRSASASSVMPGAKYPSSLDTRIRTHGFYGIARASKSRALACEVVVVAAPIVDDARRSAVRTRLELDDARGEGRDELAVVRDENERPGVLVQRGVERLDRLHVEVVRRL